MLSHIQTVQPIWDREYSAAGVIPSSSRHSPAKALLLFSELLGFRRMKRALDAGCGNGRNSLYLAKLGLQVEAIDFSPAAVAEASKRAKSAGLLDRVSIRQSNLEEPLPFRANSFDLCLDCYVFCHFLNERVKSHYVHELWRVTKPSGYAISVLFSPQDEYYARLVSADCEPIVVKDPANSIVKELYTGEKFKRSFSPPFEIQYFVQFEFDDIVQGTSYRRNILAMALQNTRG